MAKSIITYEQEYTPIHGVDAGDLWLKPSTTQLFEFNGNTWVLRLSGTATVTLPNTLGESFGGGYYVGRVLDEGVIYAIILAPAAEGSNNGNPLSWKTSNTTGPSATQTLVNGPTASSSMNNVAYPAAAYCEALNIGGYTDWYLPARDELELVFRNFKPGIASNSITLRDTTTLGSGFGLDSLPNGTNLSSSPVDPAYNSVSLSNSDAYTVEMPTTTNHSLFISGGDEAMIEAVYWSSTEFSTTSAWGQNFLNGLQSNATKNSGNFVRAVRRVTIA